MANVKVIEKRQLPPRERREPASKRRAVEDPAPTPGRRSSKSEKKSEKKPEKIAEKVATPPKHHSREASTPKIVEEGLPTRIKDGKPLPTLKEAQCTELSAAEYQSIAARSVCERLLPDVVADPVSTVVSSQHRLSVRSRNG